MGISGYIDYYRPNLQLSQHKRTKRKRFRSPYRYKNDEIIYKQLQQIEDIERHEDDRSDIDIDDDYVNEALKCRFRAQMLCDTVIEHLHDQYRDEEVQIHYEHFYRTFSLQLMLTTNTLHDIALNPFLFALMNKIDIMLQQCNVQIDECVLVGDGGRIPQAVALFNEYFNVNQTLATLPIVS